MKRVANVMTPVVRAIDSYSTVAEAANKMKMFDVGALAVTSDGSIVALLTDRDIVVRAVAESRDLNTTRIEEIMSGTPIACKTEDSIHKAAELLSIHRIHRLLVMDELNQAVGMVSLGDLIVEIAAENSRIAYGVLQEMAVEGEDKLFERSQAPPEAMQRVAIL